MLIAFTARLQGVPRVVPDRITNISLWECVQQFSIHQLPYFSFKLDHYTYKSVLLKLEGKNQHGYKQFYQGFFFWDTRI